MLAVNIAAKLPAHLAIRVLVTAVLNPDALIVRTNAHYGHLEFDTPLDARALASFSADATPAIVDALPLLSPQGQGAVLTELNRRYGSQESASGDWRTFNWSRAQAGAAIGGS